MILSILEFTSVKYFAGSITVTDFALNMGFFALFSHQNVTRHHNA